MFLYLSCFQCHITHTSIICKAASVAFAHAISLALLSDNACTRTCQSSGAKEAKSTDQIVKDSEKKEKREKKANEAKEADKSENVVRDSGDKERRTEDDEAMCTCKKCMSEPCGVHAFIEQVAQASVDWQTQPTNGNAPSSSSSHTSASSSASSSSHSTTTRSVHEETARCIRELHGLVEKAPEGNTMFSHDFYLVDILAVLHSSVTLLLCCSVTALP